MIRDQEPKGSVLDREWGNGDRSGPVRERVGGARVAAGTGVGGARASCSRIV